MPTPSPSIQPDVLNTWNTHGNWDMTGGARTSSTDSRILESPDMHDSRDADYNIYNFTGDLIGDVLTSSFWCANNECPNNPSNNFYVYPGDTRLHWDPWISRWISSTLYIQSNNWNWATGQQCTGCSPVRGGLAVSKTGSPTSAYYLYVFDLCGANDTVDGSDQPHLAFNDTLIIVAAVCNSSSQGYPLQIFDAASVAAGKSPVLNSTQWELQDPLTNNGGRGGGDGRLDAPALNYVANSPIYLTLPQLDSSGDSQVVVSYITDAEPPSLVSNSFTITDTSLPGSSEPVPLTDWAYAPGCVTAPCIGSLYPWWIQHSMVMSGPQSDHIFLITSDAWSLGSLNSYAHFVMYDLTSSTPTIVNIANQQNYTNVLGAEAVMPYVSNNGDDEVFLIYSSTANNFYPGTSYVLYDINTNSTPSFNIFQGNVSPTNPLNGPCSSNRLFDFMNGAEPIHAGKEVFFNGFLALSTSPDSLGLCNYEASVSVVTTN